METKKHRDFRMDLLRIFACFMVVFLHVSGQNFRTCDVQSSQWLAFNLYDAAVRSSVPLFFMISGKLFLSRNQMCSISTLFKKNIWKLLVLYFSWSFFYGAISVFETYSADTNLLLALIEETIHSEFHLWYLPSLIGVYMLMPVLWTVAKYENGKYLKYACIMFFCFGILKNTLLEIPVDSQLYVKLINKFSYALGGYSGYFLLGYMLDLNKEKFSKLKQRYLIMAVLVTIFACAKVNEIYSLSLNEANTLFFANLAIPSCIEAILIFIIFLKLPQISGSKKIQKMIIKVSKYTLFVYLFHPFVLDFFKNVFHMTSMSFNAWVMVPLLTCICFSICMGLAFVLEKVPVFNRWLM